MKKEGVILILYQGKSRKFIIILLSLYTCLTFYFLFLGFDRSSSSPDQGLRYSLSLQGIPLHFPMGRDFKIWFFEMGNFVAFIPFGMFIPLLFRCGFIRFISIFILCITMVETVQMISRLGAFDIDDILINTLGAAVGYGAQRTVTHHRNTLKGFIQIFLTAIIFSIGTITVVGGLNYYLDNVGGKSVALNELVSSDGAVVWDEELSSFTVGQTNVEPQINLYSKEKQKTNEFSYLLNGKYKNMKGYFAIPDDVVRRASHETITISFIADGTEIYSLVVSANSGENHPDSFQTPLKGVNELTIKVITDGSNLMTNIVMWDITLTEPNTGQKFINSIKSVF
ncbi:MULTISPECIES: VanZ family protein [Paenibacillus]|uniref:VanZ family protein n=1 Tax=Paenibacillus TaxID=44249 RepID=UPI001FC9F769|nr:MULTISPECIES: VanZ family protein [Paenibacillus]